MKKLFRCFYIVVITLLVSCTSEEKKIKNALYTSIPDAIRNEYQYNSHLLLETILKSNLTDSISELKAKIITNESFMQMDSARLREIQSNINECKSLRANTVYFLRSTYDNIIDEYEDMAEDIEEKLSERQTKIDACKDKIDFFSQSIYKSESPIVFYKVKHSYKIRGAYKETIVLINDKYEIVK